MKKHQYTGFWILVGLIFLALFISTLFKGGTPPGPSEQTYSEFVAKVQNHEISSVDIVGNMAYGYIEPQTITVPVTPVAPNKTKAPEVAVPSSSTLQAPSTTATAPATPVETRVVTTKSAKYRVILPEEGGAGVQLLVPVLERNNVPFSFHEAKTEGAWLGILTSFFLPLILFVFIFMLFRNAQGGGSQAMSFGKSRAKMSMDSKVKITFNDVAGIDEAKAELEEVVISEKRRTVSETGR